MLYIHNWFHFKTFQRLKVSLDLSFTIISINIYSQCYFNDIANVNLFSNLKMLLHNKQIDIEIFDLLLDTEITCGKLAIGKCKKYKADNCLLSEMLHMQLKLPAGGYHTCVKYEQLFAIFPYPNTFLKIGNVAK